LDPLVAGGLHIRSLARNDEGNPCMSKMSRRTLLGASGGALVAGALATGSPAADSVTGKPARASRRARARGVRLRWLGNAGWEIRAGAKTILLDPWLTRFGAGEATDPRTRLSVDPGKIDPHVDRADLILVGHGHYDHITDIPYIARRTGATVLGTESHLNMLRALDAPADQLATVRGGEYIDFDDVTVEVFPSLHSMGGERAQVVFPGTRPGAPPPRPAVVSDLVEGGTLAYQITVSDDFRIFALSTGNFIERELSGLRPDVAIVPPAGGRVPAYAARLMRALDHPRWVLPTHWDDFAYPLGEPARDSGALEPTRRAIAAASPRTRFVKLDHLETFSP
jgi:L-ascorbate metabolism protein UlaG (beta-lactamase superfamily)